MVTVPPRIKRLLDQLVDASGIERLAISFGAFVAALIVGAIIVLLSGAPATCASPVFSIAGFDFCYNPILVYVTLFDGAFGSLTRLGITLQEMSLLLFTGLSVAVAFRAGLFNIGTQGQMVLGALASALFLGWAAPLVPETALVGAVLMLFAVVIGAVVGGAYGAIPGAMKAYADAHEVVTTIMLNFVAAGVAFYLVRNHVGDPTVDTVQTETLPEHVQLAPTIGGTRFSIIALVFGLLMAVGIYFFYERTVLGYELRTSGLAPEAARYGGVNSSRNIISSMVASGALGGIAGAIYVMMILYRWQDGFPALGFDGIAVSILAGNNPVGVIPAALLFGVLKSGSNAINFSLGVPPELVEVVRGIIILFVAMPEFFRLLGRRAGYGADSQAVATDGGTSASEEN